MFDAVGRSAASPLPSATYAYFTVHSRRACSARPNAFSPTRCEACLATSRAGYGSRGAPVRVSADAACRDPLLTGHRGRVWRSSMTHFVQRRVHGAFHRRCRGRGSDLLAASQQRITALNNGSHFAPSLLPAAISEAL